MNTVLTASAIISSHDNQDLKQHDSHPPLFRCTLVCDCLADPSCTVLSLKDVLRILASSSGGSSSASTHCRVRSRGSIRRSRRGSRSLMVLLCREPCCTTAAAGAAAARGASCSGAGAGAALPAAGCGNGLSGAVDGLSGAAAASPCPPASVACACGGPLLAGSAVSCGWWRDVGCHACVHVVTLYTPCSPAGCVLGRRHRRCWSLVMHALVAQPCAARGGPIHGCV